MGVVRRMLPFENYFILIPLSHFRHAGRRYHVDPNMTRSLHHGGVLRAGISLDLTGPCPSEEVELLTSGKHVVVHGDDNYRPACD